jgi:hypothetical protein
MFVAGGLAGLLLLFLWVYCIFDVIATDESVMRNMPKIIWLLVVIFVPTVGSVAWLALGRPARAGFRPGETTYRPPPRVLGPEDSPEFMLGAGEEAKRLRRWEEELRQREKKLRRREEDERGD